MKSRNKWVVGTVLVGALVGGAGLYTNGLVPITAATVNGTNYASRGVGAYSNLEPGQISSAGSANCCGPMVGVDTNLAGGAAPQTVAATPFGIAGTLLDGLANTQTSTVHAATSNTLGGVIITEALSTAPGATYTFTLTNNLITAAYAAAGNVPTVGLYSISNTGGTTPTRNSAQMTLVSSTAAVGSVVWVWKNDGNTALNGTMYIAWHL